MDFQKMNKKTRTLLIVFGCILLIFLVALVLYHKPLFSNEPLGLDALGHVSKISYLKEFGLNVQWNMAWYNGKPLLSYYSPLYYQASYFFNDIIFGANFLCFLSIFLTSVGIFFLINMYSKNRIYSLIFSLFFLSVLCTSYYFVSVGNSPYVFGIFTIPFTLLFLEKSLESKRHNFLIYSLFFVLAYLTHIFMAVVLFLLVALRISIYCYFHKRNALVKNLVRKNLIYLSLPALISAFWFFPFLSKSGSFIGNGIGYIPLPTHLLGLGDYMIWGKAPGEIGILFGIFIISLFFIKKYFKKRDEKLIFLTISSILLFLLLEGILWKFYPTGVGAIRFILPFSIIACVFIGVIFSRKFKCNKKAIVFLVILLIVALILNYNTINENYEKYSYNSDYDRYGLVGSVYSLDEFPLENSFSNYRFGTSRYIFSETLNYKFPRQSQTWGYFDQGMLYSDKLNSFKQTVWHSENLTKTLDYLDKYAIKYFEIGGKDLEFHDKFNESDKFSLVMNKNFADYPFKVYEYKDSKPIVSIIFNNGSYVNPTKYEIIRNNPDEIKVKYDFSDDEKILFKESFHKSWKTEDEAMKEIEIKETEEGFMVLQPEENSDSVFIHQSKTNIQKLGILFSVLGIIFALVYSFLYKKR